MLDINFCGDKDFRCDTGKYPPEFTKLRGIACFVLTIPGKIQRSDKYRPGLSRVVALFLLASHWTDAREHYRPLTSCSGNSPCRNTARASAGQESPSRANVFLGALAFLDSLARVRVHPGAGISSKCLGTHGKAQSGRYFEPRSRRRTRRDPIAPP